MDEADDLVFALACAQRHRTQRKRRRTATGTTAGMSLQPAPVSASQRQGGLAEERAARYLTARGLRLLAVNLRCRAGEIDLLMRDGSVLVFVEVRSRSGTRFGGALASVGHRKRERLIRTARYFLHTTWQGGLPRCRFDVVAFDGERCCWIRDAFDDTP